MDHDLVFFPNGSVSVKPQGSSEAMHSSIGPWEEANALYVGQSRLAEALGEPAASPLVLYDLGMGIAANALAAAERFAASGARRGLRLVSFEKDTDGLRAALANIGRFPFLARNRDLATRLLEERHAEVAGPTGHALRWELKEGDFLEQDLDALPAPELIYFDFYSPRNDRGLWGVRCFSALARAAARGPGAKLYTYSAATRVRSAMLLAGFHVGAGMRTAIKNETTVAASRLEWLDNPLRPDWLRKLERSATPLPEDWPPSRLEEAMGSIRSREQFGLNRK